DSALVPLGRRPRREGAEVSPPSRPRVLLARVESVLSRGELPDHRGASAPVTCKRAAGDPASVARARALAGGVLLGGLLAAAVPAAPATDPPATAAGVLASLDAALGWYREARIAMQSAAGAPIPLFSRDDEQTALRVVARAFDAARAQAALLAEPPEHPDA